MNATTRNHPWWAQWPHLHTRAAYALVGNIHARLHPDRDYNPLVSPYWSFFADCYRQELTHPNAAVRKAAETN